MRARFPVVVTVVAALCIVAPVALRLAYPPPRLLAPVSSFEFGELAGGRSKLHSFAISNAGGRPLRITQVQASCSCTEASVTRMILLPGEAGAVTVAVHPSREFGEISGRVVIRCNDPDRPEFVFHVTARNTPALLQLSPPTINFGKIRDLTSAQQLPGFTLYCQDGNDIEVSVEDCISPSPVHVEFVKTDTWPTLFTRLEQNLSPGPLTATVTVSTRSGKAPPLVLSVLGDVLGPVRAKPDVVHLGQVAQESQAAREVRLIEEAGAAFVPAVRDVVGDGARFVAAGVEGSGSQWSLRVRVSGVEAQPGKTLHQAVVRLHCAGDRPCDLNVPVRFYSDAAPGGS